MIVLDREAYRRVPSILLPLSSSPDEITRTPRARTGDRSSPVLFPTLVFLHASKASRARCVRKPWVSLIAISAAATAVLRVYASDGGESRQWVRTSSLVALRRAR